MKSKYKIVILIALVTLLVKCDEYEVDSRNWPRLNTLDVTNISENGAKFNAEIIYRGDFIVNNYGFVWSENRNPNIGSSHKIQWSENIQTNKFSADISTTLKKGVRYYVRPFIQTEFYRVYGKNVQFLSMGSSIPVEN